MKNLNYYIDKCKKKNNFTKDVQLAEFLGIKRASMSIIKKGGGISQETALRLSQGSGEPLEEIWLACIAQREDNPTFKKVWENISKKAGYLLFPIGGASSVAQWLE